MSDLELARVQINQADAQISKSFCQRMQAVKKIAEYKKAHGLPIKDEKREAEIIAQNLELLQDSSLRKYYEKLLRSCIEVSCEFQADLMNSNGGKND